MGPIQRVLGVISPVVKRHGREAYHSLTCISSAEVNYAGAIPPLPIHLHDVMPNKLSTVITLL
jgi:hypothetical protein